MVPTVLRRQPGADQYTRNVATVRYRYRSTSWQLQSCRDVFFTTLMRINNCAHCDSNTLTLLQIINHQHNTVWPLPSWHTGSIRESTYPCPLRAGMFVLQPPQGITHSAAHAGTTPPRWSTGPRTRLHLYRFSVGGRYPQVSSREIQAACDSAMK